MGGSPEVTATTFGATSQGVQYVNTGTAAEIAANQKEDEELLMSLFQGNHMYLEEVAVETVKLSKLLDLI